MTSSHEPIEACVYDRNSLKVQKGSLPLQRENLVKMAEEKGYHIGEWYEDKDRSGSRNTHRRKELMRMLTDAPTAKWKVVLIFDISRYSRLDSIEGAFADQTLREAKKKIVSLLEGPVDWNTSSGRLMAAFHKERAHEFSHTLGHVVLRAKKKNFDEGKPYGRLCPYGMARHITSPKGKTQVVARNDRLSLPKGWSQVLIPGEPTEVKVVRWLFKTYSAKDVGYCSLVLSLNNDSIPSPTGKVWTVHTVSHILRNEIYVGDTRFGKEQTGRFARFDGEKVVEAEYGAPHQRAEGKLRSGTHEGIIDRATWNNVQAKLERRKKEAANQRRLPRGVGGYSLSGILVCGHCGRRLLPNPSNAKKKAGAIIYACRSRDVLGKKVICNRWSVKESVIRPLIIDKVLEAFDLSLFQPVSVQEPRPQKTTTQEIAARKKEIAELESKLSEGAGQLLEKKYAEQLRPVLNAKMCEMQNRLNVLRQEIEQLGKPNAAVTKAEKELRMWKRAFAAAKEELVPVEKSPKHGVACEKGVDLRPEEFREKLQECGCRVFIFFKRSGTSRFFDVDRVRIVLGYEPQKRGSPGADPENFGKLCEKIAAPSGTDVSTYVRDGAAVIVIEFSWRDVVPDFSEKILSIVQQMAVSEAPHWRHIAERLNAQKMRTRTGLPWTEGNLLAFCNGHGLYLSRLLPEVTVEKILAWADSFHTRTGRWPIASSGPILEAVGRTWRGVDDALRGRHWGLRSARSLAKLLARERGVRNQTNIPRLTKKAILAWADAHFRRTGNWPAQKSGPIAEAPGQNWTMIDTALRCGLRGLRGKSSLAQLLDESGRKANPYNRPRFSEDMILSWADEHFKCTGEWPNTSSGRVIGAPGERWDLIDNALKQGQRGLQGGTTLPRLLCEKRGVRNPWSPPPLTEDQIIRWAKEHRERTGSVPKRKSGAIPGTGETWGGVNDALRDGKRGFEGGSSLCMLLSRHGMT